MARSSRKRRIEESEEEEEDEEEQDEVDDVQEQDQDQENAAAVRTHVEPAEDGATDTESDDEPDDETDVIGDYKHGSVTRMKLHNFLTYSDVEFHPGPRLNMVVGPNGTGKSTILCALCLGLGGEPRLLGRASDIETFIQNGEDRAEIEIELAAQKRTSVHETSKRYANLRRVVIRRVIRRKTSSDGSPTKQSKSSFFIMDQPVSAKVLRELVARDFSISIDNLCTFLPQDRVGSFSGFDSKALLIETEKCLSSDMYNQHQELIKGQEKLSSGTDAVDSLKEKLDRLKMDRQRLERERQRMEQREEAQRKADLLEKKIAWLRFDEMREACVKVQEKRNASKKRMKQAEIDLTPLAEARQAAMEQSQAASIRYGALDKQTQDSKKEIDKQKGKYEHHDDAIEMTIAEIGSIGAKKASLASEVENHRKRVHEMSASLASSPDIETVEKEWDELMAQREKNLPLYNVAKRDVRHLTDEYKLRENEHQRAVARLNALNDEKSLQCQRVFERQPKLKKAYDWLDQNRDKFRRQIWGPIAIEIKTASRAAADCIEQHVPNSTLKSFVVQDKGDYDLLYDMVRTKMDLPVSILVVPNGVQQPIGQRLYSDKKMAILKDNHGILGYMDEQITAPPAVLQALISSCSVHKVLMGTRQTQVSLDEHNLLDYLSQPEPGQTGIQSCCLFSHDGMRSVRYLVSRSRYANTKSTRVEDTRPARWLAPGTDDDAKEKAEAAVEQTKGVLGDLRSQLETVRGKLDNLRNEAQELSARATEIKETRKSINKLHSRLSNAQRKLREAEEALSNDDQTEKNKLLSVLKNRISGSIKALELHSDAHQNMMQATYRCAGQRINKDKLTAEERQVREMFDDKQEELNAAKREYEKAQAGFKKMRDQLKRMKDEAIAKAPITDEHDNPLPLKAELEELAVENVVEAEAAWEEQKHRVNSIDADPNVIRQYHSILEQIEELETDIDDRTKGRAEIERTITNLRGPWEGKLDSTVKTVDKLFSNYMTELGCTGEIRLTKGETTDGAGLFQDWGIEIRVSFRENVKAQVLSARVQSGGERSVSTIMYLMALQDRMVAPFRCVDEINQGLDDRNERLVFKRIVANSTKPPGADGPTDHCGQYFLITPKLLPNLVDMEVEAMTILSIFNGPYNFRSPLDWNLARITGLRSVREREEDDDEETREMPVPKRSRRGSE